MARGYRTIRLELAKRDKPVPVYTSSRVADALKEIQNDMTLYEGVRLLQVLEAVYEQGHKDGARTAFEELDKGLSTIKRLVPHQRPGRPRKRR
jgi:sulfate adenylyltransferase subunit 1 (EFTu-like GTPase family)